MIDTTKVEGRRELRYGSYDEMLADAEQLIANGHRTLGNWSLGQILDHLAVAVNSMIDGPPFQVPAPMRLFLRLFMKKRMMTQGVPAGFKLPKKASSLLPDDTPAEEALTRLRSALDRLKTESHRAPHAGFGKLTTEEWDTFQLRHMEMHMSFAVPAE